LSAGRKTPRLLGRHPLATLLLLLAWSRAGLADTRFELVCPELTREQAAELEARIRASLLTTKAAAERVSIGCGTEGATVLVETTERRAERALAFTTADPREELIAAVEAALRELSEAPTRVEASEFPPAAAPTERPAPALPATVPVPVPAPPVPSAAAAPAPAPRAAVERPSPGPARHTLLLLGARGEPWPDGWALGAELGAGYGTRALAVGLLGAAATELRHRDEFTITEWSAALTIAWQPRWALGFRGQLGGGLSLLSVTPYGELAARDASRRGAWFAEVVLTRPIRLDAAWAVVPGAGARGFAAQRDVNVDGERQLELGSVVPRLSLGLSYALR
jgi:hypothetical protein